MRVYMRAEGKSEPSPEHLGEQAAVMGPEAPAAFSRFNSSCRLSFPNHQAHNLWLQAPNGQPQEPYPLGSNGESGLREVRELTPGHTAQGCEGTPCSLTTRAFLEEEAEVGGWMRRPLIFLSCSEVWDSVLQLWPRRCQSSW